MVKWNFLQTIGLWSDRFDLAPRLLDNRGENWKFVDVNMSLLRILRLVQGVESAFSFLGKRRGCDMKKLAKIWANILSHCMQKELVDPRSWSCSSHGSLQISLVLHAAVKSCCTRICYGTRINQHWRSSRIWIQSRFFFDLVNCDPRFLKSTLKGLY